MSTCPNCRHNPKGISSNWMYLKKCKDCGKVFCHNCGKHSKHCPSCGSRDIDASYRKIYG